MTESWEDHWWNPSGQYAPSLEVSKKIASYRETMATALGCLPEEFFFTSGGTEGNNWAISQGILLAPRNNKEIVCSSLDHSAVLEPMKHLGSKGYRLKQISPNKEGLITEAEVLSQLSEDTALLSLMWVNNETGIVTDVGGIAQAVKAKYPKILIHCDGVQGFLKLPCDFLGKHSPIDFFSLSGHKFYGPKGIGGLYVAKGRTLAPLLRGGGQERGLRSGTESTAQMAGITAAVQAWGDSSQRMAEKKARLQGLLREIPQVKLPLGEHIPTASHILPFSLVGYPSEVVVRWLSGKEIYLSAGSACHRGKESHVYKQLGLSRQEVSGMLRVSLSGDSSEDSLQALCQALRLCALELSPMM